MEDFDMLSVEAQSAANKERHKHQQFHVGDVIRRVDMPSLTFKIDDETEDAWLFDQSYTRKVFGKERIIKKTVQIFKTDDRWELVP